MSVINQIPLDDFLPDARRFHNATPTYFKALRKELRMTRREVAEMLGKTRRQIVNYENGSTPIPYPDQYCLEVIEFCRSIRRAYINRDSPKPIYTDKDLK